MWGHSFILHSKKILLFAVIVITTTYVMNYLYLDDTDEFSRYMLHELYEQDENIDRLYLGSSHVFCDVNPAVLDDVNGDNNFNLATGNQQLIASYYLLKEADKKHDIKQVYLDMYYVCTTAGMGNLHDYDAIPHSWIVLNEMKPSLNKFSYMINLSEPRYYYLTFLPFIRYKEQLFQPGYVKDIVARKQEKTWKNREYYHIRKMENGEFIMKSGEKGFMVNFGTPEQGGFYDRASGVPLKENPVTEESIEYLVKIVDYCKENDIALTWITCPVSDYQLVGIDTYDYYVEQMRDLSMQYGIPWYDFNLCKKEYLDLSSKQYWSDKGHLNSVGAELFTRFMGELLQAEENGDRTYADCFHNSYEDKISAAREEIFGLEIVDSDEYEKFLPDVEPERQGEYAIYKIRPVTNAAPGDVEIHVCLVTREEDEEWDYGRRSYADGDELEIIYDGNDGYVILGAGEHGYLYVEAKLRGAVETKNWAEVEY